MNDEQKTLCSVTATEWPWRYTFVLRPDAVIYEWTKPFDTAKGFRRYPLADLSPQVSHQMEFGHGSGALLRRAFLLFAGSACVFDSDFNHQVPLLGPFLAVLGTSSLLAGAFRLRQYDWTIITKKNGERAFSIPHSKSNRSALEIFEKQFTDAVSACGQDTGAGCGQTPMD